MERTKNKVIIPDSINCSVTKEFTQIPNELLRNPDISGKAKAILCLLLSNKEGWKSYITTMKTMMKEGEEAIRSGVAELEEHGYLIRIQYRDTKTKQWRGSIWGYTDIPNQFQFYDQFKLLEENGFEIVEIPNAGNPDSGIRDSGTRGLIIYNNKNSKEKKINDYSSNSSNSHGSSNKGITPGDFSKFWELYPNHRGSKGAALTKWEKLCNNKVHRPTWNRIQRAIKKQMESEQWQNPQFIPHASTWLNQKRWLDDATQLKQYNFEDEQESELVTGRFTEELTPEEEAENIAEYGTPTPWLDKHKK